MCLYTVMKVATIAEKMNAGYVLFFCNVCKLLPNEETKNKTCYCLKLICFKNCLCHLIWANFTRFFMLHVAQNWRAIEDPKEVLTFYLNLSPEGAAVIWPKYCRYGVKHYTINQSTHQRSRYASFTYIYMLWSKRCPNFR